MTRRDVLLSGLGLGLLVGGGLLLTPETRETQRARPLRFVFTTPTAPTLTWGSAFRVQPGAGVLPEAVGVEPHTFCFKPDRAAATWTLLEAEHCRPETSPRASTGHEGGP
jgi:hypothetical protein